MQFFSTAAGEKNTHFPREGAEGYGPIEEYGDIVQIVPDSIPISTQTLQDLLEPPLINLLHCEDVNILETHVKQQIYARPQDDPMRPPHSPAPPPNLDAPRRGNPMHPSTMAVGLGTSRPY